MSTTSIILLLAAGCFSVMCTIALLACWDGTPDDDEFDRDDKMTEGDMTEDDE